MKNWILGCLAVLLSFSAAAEGKDSTETIQWMTIEEAYAQAMQDSTPKRIFIDVYTDWCGWCKTMDKNTFNNPEVAAYMNANFYNVKFNAEQKDSVNILGQTFKYVENGRRGYHELAAALLQNKMSYPTVVFLNGKFEMIAPVPGYQKPEEFLLIAEFIGSGIYLEKSWEVYLQEKKAEKVKEVAPAATATTPAS